MVWFGYYKFQAAVNSLTLKECHLKILLQLMPVDFTLWQG